MRIAIRDPDAIEMINRHAMRVEYLPLAVAEEILSVRRKDDYRHFCPAQDVQTPGFVHSDLTDTSRPAFDRHGAPIALDLIETIGQYDASIFLDSVSHSGL